MKMKILKNEPIPPRVTGKKGQSPRYPELVSIAEAMEPGDAVIVGDQRQANALAGYLKKRGFHATQRTEEVKVKKIKVWAEQQ